jgi:hypothetical protein
MIRLLLPVCLVSLALPLSLHAQSAGMVFDQPTTGDRLVVMEAENAGVNTAAAGDTWTIATLSTSPVAPTGYQGASALVCTPNNGSGNDGATAYINGPRLSFRVLFRSTGTHFLWIRGRALDDTALTPTQPPGNNDSCHVALDGVAIATGYQVSGFVATEWRWSRTRNGGNISFNVTTTGVHTVDVYMREDGFLFDRILLSNNAAYAPNPVTAAGPAQSGQVTDAIATPVVLSATPGPMVVSLSWTTSANAATYTLQRASATADDWTSIVTQAGTTYPDTALIQGQSYRYRVFSNQPSLNLSVGPSNIVTVSPNAPLPRTEGGNEEGLLGDNCALGSASPAAPGTWAALGLAGLVLLLGALRRRA